MKKRSIFLFEIQDFQAIRNKAQELDLNWDDYKKSFCSIPQISPLHAADKQSKFNIPFERLVSFHRFTWLRHRFMNSLCSKNDDFISPADVLKTIISWLERNCMPTHPEWEPYSVSERLINWTWCLMWLRALNAISLSQQNLLEAAIKSHASYLETHLEYHGRRTNNHILKNAQGLIYAGCLFFEDKNGQRWRDTAKDIFFAELEREFSKDWVHLEQTSHYHCLCARRYVDCFLLGHKAGLAWAQELLIPIKGMIDVAYSLTFPDSTIPLFSDISPDEPPSLAPRTLLNVGGYIFKEEKYFQKSGGMNLEALWLLGTRVTNTSMPRSTRDKEGNSLKVFPESFAAGDGNNICWRIDCGPVGFKYAPGHGHNDMLSLQVWNDGHVWIRDSGILTYDDYERKKYFKSTYAHSTVVIDEKEQLPEPGKIGMFLSRVQTRKAYPVWSKTSEDFTAILCEHTGYVRFGVGVLHKRLIIASKIPEYVVVIDYLLGKGKHSVEQLFQIDCERVSLDENKNGFELEHYESKFAIVPFANKATCNTLQEGFFSPYYGSLKESLIINFKSKAKLPLVCGAILAPEEIGRIDIKASFDESAELNFVLKLNCHSEIEHYIGVNLLGESTSMMPFEGKFKLACLFKEPDGKVTLLSDGECRVNDDFVKDNEIGSVNNSRFIGESY